MNRKSNQAAVSVEEMELWPDLMWRLAALLRAGCLPAVAFAHLNLDSVEIEKPEDPIERILSTRERKMRAQAQADVNLLVSRCQDLTRRGLPLAVELANLEVQREHSRQRIAEFAACWQINENTGAPLAEVIERLARFYENTIDLTQARDSAMSGPKTTGHILSWLPLLGLGLGILMGTNPLGILFGSVLGALVALCGVGLALWGRRWTARLVASAERGEL